MTREKLYLCIKNVMISCASETSDCFASFHTSDCWHVECEISCF